MSRLALPAGYLSPSQITTYMTCPRQYEHRYVDGEKSPPGGATVQGTAVHRAAQVALARKMVNPFEDLTLDELKDAARDSFAENIGEAALAVDEEPEALQGEALRLVETWHRDVFPLLNPVGVEERWNIEIDGIPVLGYIDVREPNGICDLKTVGRAPNEDQAEKSIQFALYHVAGEVEHGMTDPTINTDYIVKNKTPRHVRQSLVLPEGRLAAAEDAVVDVAEGISAGYFPRNPSAFICNPKNCPFYARCFGGKRHANAVAAAGVT
ncbi:MAG: PD-(D/E)XK nuclease family protein [Chloroflexota bacterium]|nr:PD-(D/E)XK nuclease family protein [Chloroflexota bacterium]